MWLLNNRCALQLRSAVVLSLRPLEELKKLRRKRTELEILTSQGI
jgi:hypothetical protein